MTTLLIVEPETSAVNLWRAREPDGTQHSGLTAVEVEALAFKWRATAATPEQAAEYSERQRLALEYGNEYLKQNCYAAPDPERGYEDPPEGTVTPSRLRAYLKHRGVGDCTVTLSRKGLFYIDVPFNRLNQWKISVRKVAE